MLNVKSITNYDCDVLIVGGGPAGSSLAYHLAKEGRKVIVVEAEEFPRDKVCGDGVSPIAVNELHKMNITNFDEFNQANEINEVGLFVKNNQISIPLSKPPNLPFHAKIVARIQLDNMVYETAQKVGAIYFQNTRVIGYEVLSNCVKTELRTVNKSQFIKSKMIVGADGSSSTIYRQLNGSKPDDTFQLLGLRAYYEDVAGPTNRVDIHFSEECFPGIYWCFPLGEKGANVGMAMVSKTIPKKPNASHVKTLLSNYIENNPDLKKRLDNAKLKGKIVGWPITFYNNKSKRTGNRVLLVGDAAGLINPLSDDGIQYALLSGRWASETILKSLHTNDFSEIGLNSYNEKIKEELSYDFSLSNLLVQFPRNKSMSKLWFGILEVMIAKAKEDKEYADIVAGIFEGTYPSYKALNAPFILKSIKKSLGTLGKNAGDNLNNPDLMLKNLQSINSLFEELIEYKGEHLDWIKTTLSKTLNVAGHVIKNVAKKGS